MAIEMRSAFRIEVDGKPVLAGVFFCFLAVLGMYRSPLADNRLLRGVRHPHSASTTRVGVEGFSADCFAVDLVYDWQPSIPRRMVIVVFVFEQPGPGRGASTGLVEKFRPVALVQNSGRVRHRCHQGCRTTGESRECRRHRLDSWRGSEGGPCEGQLLVEKC